MSILRQAAKPVGKTIARLINSNLMSIETFRNLDFKGKLTISGYLNSTFFSTNGIHQCRDVLFDIDFKDDIQKYIYLNLYENREANILKKYIKPGGCCVDVGANIGYYSLHMAKAVGAMGKVFAFEPDPTNLERLDRNISLNGVEKIVTTYPLGLSSETTTKNFSRTPDSNSGWGRIVDENNVNSSLQIQTITLDEFVAQNQLEKINFLKCDIEGHEFEFLKGADLTLATGKIDLILIEYLVGQGHSLKDYIDVFQEHDYQPFLLNLDLIKNHECNKHGFNIMFAKS